MSFDDMYSGNLPLWKDGPTPGCLYDFPRANTSLMTCNNSKQFSQSPITTTTSVLAIKFDGGIVMVADKLGSYGSLARFPDCPRILSVNKNILIGASGDYADFQYLREIIKQKIVDEDCLDDGFSIKPKALYCWLTRVMYNRRTKMDPLWNDYVVAGMQDGVPFLGAINMLGASYADNTIATGYGTYLALPMMRDAYEKNPQMTKTQAQEVLNKCMEVLYYRDGRAYNKYRMATITADGVEEADLGPIVGKWSIA